MDDPRAAAERNRFGSLDLIFYGGDLSQVHTGVAVYLRSLIRVVQKPPTTLKWAVALPEPRQNLANDFPPENRLIIPGKDIRGHLRNEIAWQTRTARWVKQHAPQAVFHTPFHFWSSVVPRRMMMTVHDCIEMRVPEVQPAGWMRRLHRKLSWRMVRRATQVIAVSDWTRQELAQLVGVPLPRIEVIYNWPGPQYSRTRDENELARVRRVYQLPSRYIAYLGGFRSYKNVGLLIEAWQRARARESGCPDLVLAGALPPDLQGGFYSDVRSAIERTGEDGKSIFIPGAIRDADLPFFYAGASLFVSPSRYEGFGYPPVEASACGTPVLVADRSAFRELFPEHLRFPANDPEKLAEKILAALQDPTQYVHSFDRQLTEEYGKQKYEQQVRRLRTMN